MEKFQSLYAENCEKSGTDELSSITQLSSVSKRLRVSSNVSFLQMECVCRSFKFCELENLEELDFSESFLGAKGAELLLKTLNLERRCGIKRLNLSGINLEFSRVGVGEDGKLGKSKEGGVVESLGLFVGSTAKSCLEELSLEWNNLGVNESSFASLCNSLSSCAKLRVLDLRNNRVSAKGVSSICTYLFASSSSPLVSLDLRWNSIGSSGGKIILEKLKASGNKNIKEIKLSGNSIDFQIINEIQSFLNGNNTLASKKLKEVQFNVKVDQQLTHIHKEQTSKIKNLEEVLHFERGGFESKINNSILEIENLKGELTSLRNNTKSLKENTHKKGFIIQNLENRKKILEENLANEKTTHEQQVDYYKKKLEGVQSLQKETNDLLNKTTSEFTQVQLELETLKKENIGVREREKALVQKLNHAEKELRERNKEFNKTINESVILTEKIGENEKQLQSLLIEQKKYVRSEKKIVELEKEIVTLKSQFHDETVALGKQSKFNLTKLERALESKIFDSNSENELLKKQMEKAKLEISQLKENVQFLTKGVEKEKRRAKTKIETVEIEKSGLENQNSSLRLENKQNTYTIEKLQDQEKDNLKKHEVEMKKLNEKLQGIMNNHSQQKERLLQQISKKDQENLNYVKEISSLKSENSVLQEKIVSQLITMESQLITSVKRIVASHKEKI